MSYYHIAVGALHAPQFTVTFASEICLKEQEVAPSVSAPSAPNDALAMEDMRAATDLHYVVRRAIEKPLKNHTNTTFVNSGAPVDIH